MPNPTDMSKRAFLKTALGVGGVAAGASLLSSGGSVREAYGQILESGINPNSALARVKKTGVLKVGWSATPPWFQKDPKRGGVAGLYYDVAERLAKEIEVKAEYQEVAWANATIGLRKGDFDVFGSSLFYTMPRALVVNYIGPFWRKGRLVLTHKDFADRFKGPQDFNSPNVTFTLAVGTSEENWIKNTFPRAKLVTHGPGQAYIAAQDVRLKKAHLFATGDLDSILFARKNKSWAHIIDEKNPIGMTPNTWATRYGDDEWKHFLDFFAGHMVTSGFMQERYDYWLGQIEKKS